MGSKTNMTDICIVGGGLTGMMMGVALAHTPYQIMLLDKSDGGTPPVDGRTTTIHAAGQRMLAALGIWDHLTQMPTAISGIRVTVGEAASGLKARQKRDFDLEWTSPETPMGYVVDNGDLWHALSMVLATHVADGNISHITGFAVAKMACQSGMAALHSETDPAEIINCDLVVGCDGGSSPLRTGAGLRQIRESQLPGYRAQTAIVATMRLESDHNHMAYQRFLPGGPIALMPMNGRLASLVWTLPITDAERLLMASDDEFSSACTKAFGPALGFLTLAGPRLEWPLKPGVSPRMSHQNLVLAGDAAHALHPLAGQGYNLALGDAAVLADALTMAHRRGLTAGHSTMRTAYESGRRVEVAAMTGATTSLNLLFSDKPAAISSLMGMGMGLVNASPFKSIFAKMAQGGTLAKASLLDGKLPGQH